MFQRCNERARNVVVLAQDEARYFKHNYVGTEHLLLGLIREEEGIAAQALYSLSVGLEKARKQVETIVGYGDEATGAEAPFTPRTKKVLELALKEAIQLGHSYIGTEHMLLGLVREREGVAARVLDDLHVDRDKVRKEVIRRLGGGRAGQAGKKSKTDNASLWFEIQSLKKEVRRLSTQVRKLREQGAS
jgi:ATP-dependent Clp protease ATP-binding subunit ClpC